MPSAILSLTLSRSAADALRRAAGEHGLSVTDAVAEILAPRSVVPTRRDAVERKPEVKINVRLTPRFQDLLDQARPRGCVDPDAFWVALVLEAWARQWLEAVNP